MTDDSLPLNEQATATEDYEMISNNIIISDEQTFASINITILHRPANRTCGAWGKLSKWNIKYKCMYYKI